jgi:uncharacterized protein (TIGR03437 family)
MSFRVLAILAASVAAAQDWPVYLHDLAHSSFSADETTLGPKTVQTLTPLWTYKSGAFLGSGSTLVNGVVYFGDWSGNFNAVDAKSGALIWKTYIGVASPPARPDCFSGAGVSSQAAILGNTIYVGGGDAAFYALDLATGKQLARVPLGDPNNGVYLWSSVMAFHDFLYIGISSLGDCPIVRGAIAKLDPANLDQPLLRYLVPDGQIGAGIWSTPAIDATTGDLFIATANGEDQDPANGNYSGTLMKVDSTTLEDKAYYVLPYADAIADQVGGGSPILFTPPGGSPLMATPEKNGILYAVKRSDMTLAWKRQLAVDCVSPQQGCGAIATPAFDGTAIYAAAGVRDPNGFANGSVYALNPADGSVLWVRDIEGPVLAPVTVANGLLYVPSTRGLLIFDAGTGQLLWNDNTRAALYGQVVISNGNMITNYVKGDLIRWSLPSDLSTTAYAFSAASGLSSIAPSSIAQVYGTNLGQAQVTVEDSSGTLRPVQTLYTTPSQLAFVVPDATQTGQAILHVLTAGNAKLTGTLQVNATAPGFFSANADGKGPAAAVAVHVAADGSQTSVPVYQCGVAPGSCQTVPIELGPDTSQTYLTLFGTGIRGRNALSDVTVTIGGVAAPVLYAGAQPQGNGLDQVNVLIPPSLRGKGQANVVLMVDGQLSNAVTVAIK